MSSTTASLSTPVFAKTAALDSDVDSDVDSIVNGVRVGRAGYFDNTNSVDVAQLIAAHRAISGLEHALMFCPDGASHAFRDMVFTLDALGATQLEGEPVWMQLLIDEPGTPSAKRVKAYACLARRLAESDRQRALTQSTAQQIARTLSVGELAFGKLSRSDRTNDRNRRVDTSAYETIRQGLSNWEHALSDQAGEGDGLIRCALADARFRRLSPFNTNNETTAGLLLNLSLRHEQLVQCAPLCLSAYFSRQASQFAAALADDESVVRFYLTAVTKQSAELLRCLSRVVEHMAHCEAVATETLPRAPIGAVMRAIARPVCTNADLKTAGITRRQTSSSYLKKLSAAGLLEPRRYGKEIHYVNRGVVESFQSLI